MTGVHIRREVMISQESIALICCCIDLYQFKYLLNEFLNHIHYRALTRFYSSFSLVYICIYYRCPATGASCLGSLGRNVLLLRWELQATCLDDFIYLIPLLSFSLLGMCRPFHYLSVLLGHLYFSYF